MALLVRPPALEFWKEFDYVRGPDLVVSLKVYLPQKEGSKKHAVAVYFHGGAAIVGDSEDYSRPLFKGLSELGVLIVSANYRLLPNPDFTVRQVFEDIKRLEIWLRNDLAEKVTGWNLYLDHFLVIGSSFGGYLALKAVDFWTAPPLAVVALYAFVTMDAIVPVERYAGFQLNEPEILGSIMQQEPISQFPPATKVEDLQHPRHHLAKTILGKGIFAEFLCGVMRWNTSWQLPKKGHLSKEDIDALAPLNDKTKKCPPICDVRGEMDDIAPFTHSVRLKKLAEERGALYTPVVVPGKGHAFDIEANDSGEIQEVLDWVRDRLEQLSR